MGKAKQIFTAASRVSYNRLALNYYAFCEMCKGEEIDPGERSLFDEFHFLMEQFLGGMLREESVYNLREKLILEMKHITYYAEALQLYEYVMNRIEPRFIPLKVPNLDTSQKRILWVLNYLFQENGKNNLNQRIQNALSQLPVRLTNRRFFALLRQGMEHYRGESSENMDFMLESLRSDALADRQLESWENHQEEKEFLDHFRKTDYIHMDEAAFRHLSGLLEEEGRRLEQISSQNILLTDLVNDLQVLTFALPQAALNPEEKELFDAILGSTARLFESNDVDQEDMDQRAAELLAPLEGGQEDAIEQWNNLERWDLDGVLGQMPEKQAHSLEKIRILLSTSTFASLEQKKTAASMVKDSEWEEKLSLLEQDLSCAWKGCQRRVVRGMMARMLSRMPGAFENGEQLKEYITGSLESCSDEGEAVMSVNLLRRLADWEDMDEGRR